MVTLSVNGKSHTLGVGPDTRTVGSVGTGRGVSYIKSHSFSPINIAMILQRSSFTWLHSL